MEVICTKITPFLLLKFAVSPLRQHIMQVMQVWSWTGHLNENFSSVIPEFYPVMIINTSPILLWETGRHCGLVQMAPLLIIRAPLFVFFW